ncbi:MAG: hypothetical protein IPP73_11775 [Chitinophagaceae bacterium]|nr:hypothetical protein [Chitinophagaceae bacterium]
MQAKLFRSYRIFSILFIIIIFSSCSSKSKGYSDLDKLYSDFVVCLKSTPERLKKYCEDISPDKGTVAYMKKHKFSYRGIPEELEKRKLSVSFISDEYYKRVANFKEDLIASRKLDDLTYIGREEPGEELFDKELGIYATETFILLKSNNDTIECKLGEMFKIDGKWKSFTEPKLGW